MKTSSQNKKPELSVVLPVFKEEKNIPLVVEKYKALAKRVYLELIFVEDTGKMTKTREAILFEKKKNKFIVPLFTEDPGYGASIFNGLKKAKGEYICWTHSDLQTDPADTLKALNIIKKTKDPKRTYIKGKRYGRPLLDTFLTGGMSIFETIYLGKKMKDINAQPNLFHRSFISHLNNPPNDFAFDLYSYYIAKKLNYNIVRFPVFFGKRLHGKSAWNDGVKSRIKFIKRTIKFSMTLKKRLNEK